MKFIAAVLFFVLGGFSAHAFDSFEHLWIGDSVKLHFPDEGQDYVKDYPYKSAAHLLVHDLKKKDTEVPKLTPSYLVVEPSDQSSGSAKFSFGEIVALAGDFIAM